MQSVYITPCNNFLLAELRTKASSCLNNTVRQIIGAIGSALAVVLMAVFAGGNVDHNAISVTAFGETSIVMSILAVVMLVIVILFVHDDVEKVEV